MVTRAEVARVIMDKAIRAGYAELSSDIPELDFPFVSEMLQHMERGEVSAQEESFFLGWILAAVLGQMCGSVTYDEISAAFDESVLKTQDCTAVLTRPG